eukprot:4917481-Pyramimonas_sp.AAC.2
MPPTERWPFSATWSPPSASSQRPVSVHQSVFGRRAPVTVGYRRSRVVCSASRRRACEVGRGGEKGARVGARRGLHKDARKGESTGGLNSRAKVSVVDSTVSVSSCKNKWGLAGV